MAAPSARRPGLAVRADRLAFGLHRGPDERRPCQHDRPPDGPGPLRPPDAPARGGPAAGSARPRPLRRRVRRVRRVRMTIAAALLAYAAGVGTIGSVLL